MGSVKIVKKEYRGWENCIEISNGIIDIIATTDVGLRIIRFGFTGKENEFCEVEGQVGTTGGDEWKIYGGHRLWHSPEYKPRSYEPDNSKIDYREKENGIVLSQPVEPWAQIKKEIEVTISPCKPEVYLLHRLVNKGAWPVKLAAWALTVMAPGGLEIIPLVKKDTGLLPNSMISLWPYTRLNDSRVYWGEKYIMLRHDSNARGPFKIGLPNEDGWAAYANHGHLFVKKYNHIDGATYPDFGASFETYTCDFMTEIESLSPMIELEPGKSIEHRETWILHDNVKVPETEDDIDRIILPLAKG
ncbi:MAG: hypothetical protein GX754_03080 [Clostridiaceae bacterium]|nr:hypothetical protein [Clostridiaceae bacterium]